MAEPSSSLGPERTALARAIAEDPGPERAALLARCDDPVVIEAAWRLVGKDAWWALVDLASHPAAPTGLLVEATRSRWVEVALAAVRNPAASEDVRIEACLGGHCLAALAVLADPGVTRTHVECAARSPLVGVRQAAARHPLADEKVRVLVGLMGAG
jgi:hypothetical protein